MWANSYFDPSYFDGEYWSPIAGDVQLPGPGYQELGVYDLGLMLSVHGAATGLAAVGHNTDTKVITPDQSLVAVQGDTGLGVEGDKSLGVDEPEADTGSGQGERTLRVDDDKRLH